MRHSPAEVAVSLGVAYATVLDWLRRGYLKGTRGYDGRWLIRRKAVRRALRDCREIAAAVNRAMAKRETREISTSLAAPSPVPRIATSRSGVANDPGS